MTFIGNAQTVRADGTKECSKCGDIKPLSEFARASKEKSGYASACKVCRKALYQGLQNERNRLRYAEDPQYRERKKAAVVAAFQKNAANYSDQRRTRYELNDSVRRAAVDRVDKWRAANQDSVRVYGSRRRAKAVGADGDFEMADVIRLFEKQNSQCIYCGADISEGRHTIEHLVPLSRGGSNAIENVALACRSCNARKGDKTVAEFLET